MKLTRFAPLGLIVLAACAPEVEADLYLQDFVEVADTGKTITVDARLRIPENTEDSCKEGVAELAGKLAAFTPLSDQGTCVEVDNNQFSEFTMEMPILPEGTEDAGHLVVMHVARTEDDMGAGLALSVTLNRSMAEVQEAIGRSESSGFTISTGDNDQPKFIFNFQNDTRETAGLLPNYVFVDDEPGLPIAGNMVNLDRRDDVKIVLADVVAAHVAKANSYTFATVYPGAN